MSDRDILRDLAQRYMDVCAHDVQNERRDLWRRHNSLHFTRPLIYTRAFAWSELPESECRCEDAVMRGYEDNLRRKLYWSTLGDDSVFEPWFQMHAAIITPPGGVWGISPEWISSDVPRGARRWNPPIREESDAALLVPPHHVVDEETTARQHEALSDVIGDILPVEVSRAPAWRVWNGDISTQLAYLRGIEQMMLDMVDRPEWLHGVLAFMRDGVIRSHEEAEQAGHWSLMDHENQAATYAEELSDPAPNCTSPDGKPVTRDQLWYYCASQETTGVGPAMFDEFMLSYQIPIMAPFGLVAYGCCEDLTNKIDVLRKIPNLRRIAVAPVADVARCAERIGTDYVISYRPNPAEMVSNGFDRDHIRNVLTRDLTACRGLHVDITLKDIETVENDGTRVREWVRITREVIDEVWV